MSLSRAAFGLLLGLLLIPGCSEDGDTVTTIINDLSRGTLTLTADGGTTSGGLGSVGGTGGDLDLSSGGNMFVGVNPPPLPPALPAAPTTGTAVTSWTDGQVITSGNAILNGSVTAATTGFEATLTVRTGDLVINGTLTAANNGIDETSIVLDVPAGTVWIFGTIRTGRVDGVSNGDNAGMLTINAQRIIFAGSIDARGEDSTGPGAIAGDAGFITFATEGGGQTSQLLRGGSMNLTGGNASGGNSIGGDGGAFFSSASGAANGAIHIHGTTFSCNGGTAGGTFTTGGLGGSLDLQGNGGVFFNAAFTGRGGAASAGAGDAFGGNGGDFFVNDLAVADSGPVAIFGSIDISGGSATGDQSVVTSGGFAGFVDIRTGSDLNAGAGVYSLRGGDSFAAGGAGGFASLGASVFSGSSGDLYFDGTLDVSDGSGAHESVATGTGNRIDIDAGFGDVQISGSLIANGGGGSDSTDMTVGPSAGGIIGVQTADGGSITIRGLLRANGGAGSDSSVFTDGAFGGFIQFLCSNPTGSIYLDPGSQLNADGGHVTFNGAIPGVVGLDLPWGGDAGIVELNTGGGSIADGLVGGNINLRGSILARGGNGLASVDSFGGFGGEILVDSDSVLTPFGGGDGRGGDITLHAGATIDASGGFGGAGGDGLEVVFDADGNDSDDPAENGIVLNFGTIVVRGGGPVGFGGDVEFDGLDSALNPGPLPGNLDLFGLGSTGVFQAR